MPPILLPESYQRTQDTTHVFAYLIILLLVQLLMCFVYVTSPHEKRSE